MADLDPETLRHRAGELLDRCRFPPPGARCVCGVSGGPDSTALLALAVAAGLRPQVVHVDHGLRAESASDAELVVRTASRLGLSVRVERVTIAAGPNLEERSRQARYRVLGAGALTGHTLDDQAETVLIALLRGSGVAGLAAIPEGPTRPLLGLRRSETRALCADLDIEVVTDPSNADPAFVRNRVRNELLPLLDGIAARDVAPLLARTARQAAAADRVVRERAAQLDPTDAAALVDADPLIAGEALRRWWQAVTGSPHPPGVDTVDRMLAVAHGRWVATQTPGGWRLARRRGRLRLEPPGGAAR